MDNNNMNQPQDTYQQPAPQAVPPQQTYQQTYQQPAQQAVYQQPVYQNPAAYETPVSVGNWILTFLIMCVPCVNVIMMFVWAFSGSTPKSKSNFFKAVLILYAIMLVVSVVIAVVFGSTLAINFDDIMRL